MDIADAVTCRALSRAIGEELRRVREAKDWSRDRLVARLPSGIGPRTLLSYEHGTRHLTVLRLLELCHVLGAAAPLLLSHALQRAQLELANLELQVDLQALIKDRSSKFRPLVRWARCRLNRCPDGIAVIPPSSVEELADFVGYPRQELASYLARFTPETNVGEAETDEAETADIDQEQP